MKYNFFDIYPFNLSLAIFKDEIEAKEIHVDSLEHEVELIDETAANIIKLRFKERMSLSKIGAEVGFGPKKVKQYLESGLESLRRPSRIKYYKAIPFIEHERLIRENKL